ncbi:hypothetical protein GALMADRAFT_253848 [Galerina marginata CBS 339.88]|uniref:Uncharacterized protein n=1 Tax=Galerina marginata (strain CBS 339.88) TaxID=685588 RepID=A0A067SND4_GALM3|nr:hypothetical protein GALMADRAFT_253848 [Galerina marginata CBS 339.88]
MEAILRSGIDEEHPWRTKDITLFDELTKHYESITQTLHQADHNSSMLLKWKWNFLSTSFEEKKSSKQDLEPTKRDLLYLGRGYEHQLKTELIRMWSRWIVSDLGSMWWDALYDCQHVSADAASEKAKLELTELDFQLARECTSRELFLVSSSTKIEGVLERRMKECMIVEDRENGGLKEWMLSEFWIGRTKRLEKERRQAKDRMEKTMKDASERAEREGRPWSDRELEPFSPRWKKALELIDKQWLAGIELQGDHAGLQDTASDELDKQLRDIRWGRQEQVKFVKQFRQPFEHWHPRREIEQSEMDATIERISNLKADSNGEDLDDAYQYPLPEQSVTSKFVQLKYLKSQRMARAYSATVYDVKDCDDKDLILDVIKMSNTRSVINVDPALVDSIPENDHLLYIGTSGKEPAFIQRNRNRWWDQQTGNSSTFYFCPETTDRTGAGVSSDISTIAHIYIFLKMPSRLRLRLLHRHDNDTSVAFQEKQEKGKKLHPFTSREIPEYNPNQLRLQDFDSDQVFEPGRHELELVVTSDDVFYFLRDILTEFLDDSPSDSSLDDTGNNLATKVEQGDTDVGSSGIGVIGAEEDSNANALPSAVENDIPSSDL